MSFVYCPSCGAHEFYYVQKALESHRATDVDENGDVELSYLANWAVDGTMEPYFECEHPTCKKKFRLVPHENYAFRFQEIPDGVVIN